MTISGLNGFLKKRGLNAVNIDIKYLKNKKVCIDTSNLMYRYFNICLKEMKELIFLNNKTVIYDKWFSMLGYLVDIFNSNNIKTLWIFDGKADILKKKTQDKRRQIYQDRLKLKKECEERDPDSAEYVTLDNMISRDDLNKLQEYLYNRGCNIVISKTESERTCAILCKQGKYDLAYSQDSDLLAHGCNLIIKELNRNVAKIQCLTTVLNCLEISYEKFLMFCLLCGTDYSENVDGYGPVSNYKLIKEYSSIEEILEVYKNENLDYSMINYYEVIKLFI